MLLLPLAFCIFIFRSHYGLCWGGLILSHTFWYVFISCLSLLSLYFCNCPNLFLLYAALNRVLIVERFHKRSKSLQPRKAPLGTEALAARSSKVSSCSVQADPSPAVLPHGHHNVLPCPLNLPLSLGGASHSFSR